MAHIHMPHNITFAALHTALADHEQVGVPFVARRTPRPGLPGKL
jgi:hypothetical protein